VANPQLFTHWELEINFAVPAEKHAECLTSVPRCGTVDAFHCMVR